MSLHFRQINDVIVLRIERKDQIPDLWKVVSELCSNCAAINEHYIFEKSPHLPAPDLTKESALFKLYEAMGFVALHHATGVISKQNVMDQFLHKARSEVQTGWDLGIGPDYHPVMTSIQPEYTPREIETWTGQEVHTFASLLVDYFNPGIYCQENDLQLWEGFKLAQIFAAYVIVDYVPEMNRETAKDILLHIVKNTRNTYNAMSESEENAQVIDMCNRAESQIEYVFSLPHATYRH